MSAVCCLPSPNYCGDTYFLDNPDQDAYAFFPPLPDICGALNITDAKAVVWANKGSDTNCDYEGHWAFDDSDFKDLGRTPIFQVLGHELGHDLGMQHSQYLYWDPLMNPTDYGYNLLSTDDVEGVASMYGYGYQSVKTVDAVDNGDGTLSFGAVQTIPISATWKPEIATNPDAAWESWDYAIAWIAIPGQVMTVTTGTDAADGSLQLGTIHAQTTDYGYSDLGVARLNGGGRIITYVWPTSNDDALTYHIKTSADVDAFNYPRHKVSGLTSRSGFSVAPNYRTGTYRFLWHDN